MFTTESKSFWHVPPVVLGVLVVTALFSVLVFLGSELVFTQTTELQKHQHRLSDARAHALQIHSQIERAHSAYLAYTHQGDAAYLTDLQQASRQALLHYGLLKGSLSPEAPQQKQIVPFGAALQNHLDALGQAAAKNLSPPSDAVRQPWIPPRHMLTRIEEIDRSLQTQARAVTEGWVKTLRRQRIGLAVLVGLNLLFLSSLAARTLRHFYDHEIQRLRFSSRNQALQEAVQQRTTELHDLTTYLQRQSEKEKSSLARELHDELGALLTSAKLDLAWLEGHEPGDDRARIERLKRLSGALNQAFDLKRKVVENLRPSLLDHLGLAAALPWHVQETCDKAGLRHRIEMTPTDLRLEGDTALALYRIVQEALNNTIQHAHATAVQLTVVATPQRIVLTYQDDGRGIPHLRQDRLSHGIAGMRHRAMAIGAHFDIRSQPGQGTSIEVSVPLLTGTTEASASTGPQLNRPCVTA